MLNIQTQPQTEEITAPAGNRIREDRAVNRKMFAIVLGIAVFTVLLFLVFLSLFSGTTYAPTDHAIRVFESKDGFTLVFDNEEIVAPGSGYTDHLVNADRTIAVYLDGSGALYYVTDEEADLVAEGVSTFAMSANGTAVVYTANENEGKADLYRFDGKKSRQIDSEVDTDSELLLSPCGDRIVYYKNFNDDRTGFETYISNGKKATLFGESRHVYGVADKAKYVYWMEMDDGVRGNVFVTAGKTDTKIGAGSELVGFHFNATLSEALVNYNGKCYVVKDGAEKQLVYRAYYVSSLAGYDTFPMVEKAQRVSLKTFAKTPLWMLENGAEYKCIVADGAWEAEQIRKVTYGATYIDLDGEYIYTLYGDSIRRINVADQTDFIDFGDEVVRFVISYNSKHIYYLNDADELYYISSAGKNKKKVADEVYRGGLTAYNDTAYFLTDYANGVGTLCSVTKTGAKKTLANGASTSALITTNSGIMFLGDYSSENNTATLYRIRGKAGVTKLIENIITY